MDRDVRIWAISGLVAGIILGAIIGTVVGEGTIVGWVPIMGIAGLAFAGLWGYATGQQRKIRRLDRRDS